jgi:hypothetical protein
MPKTTAEADRGRHPGFPQRFPLTEARDAHELLGKGGLIGKIVLVRNGLSLETGAA